MEIKIDLLVVCSAGMTPEEALQKWADKIPPFRAAEIPAEVNIQLDKKGKPRLEVILKDPTI